MIEYYVDVLHFCFSIPDSISVCNGQCVYLHVLFPTLIRLQGVVIVNQDLLRDAVIATNTDGMCLAAPLR